MLPFILLVLSVLAQQTFAEEPEAIVGGEDAIPGEFPYQVSLRFYEEHICGGSIISPTKILTAAHCVDIASPPYRNFTVATGTIDIEGGQIHKVAKIVTHPEYSEGREDAWNNDVAVITLAAPIEYNRYQSSIALTKSPPTAKQQCTLSGWGLTAPKGEAPDILQKMKQVVVARDQCQQIHSRMPLTDSHLCAIDRSGIGACQGDSGGPLVSNGVQIGLISWSISCARGKPDVYTDVYYHRKFINQS